MKPTINDALELVFNGETLGKVADYIFNNHAAFGNPDLAKFSIPDIQEALEAAFARMVTHVADLVAANDAADASLAEHQRLSGEAFQLASAEMTVMGKEIAKLTNTPTGTAIRASFARLTSIASAVASPVKARELAVLQQKEDEARQVLADIEARRASLATS